MAFNQNPKKFLDSTGVSTLWSRINTQLANRDALIAANKKAIADEVTRAKAAEKANADAAAANKTAIETEVARAKAAEEANASAIGELQTDMGNMDGVSTTAKNVAGAINELKTAIGAGGTSAALTIDTETTTEGAAKSYTIKQGGSTVGVIDIPKDMVVSAGEVVELAEGEVEGQAKGTYIKLTLANSQAPLYINVADLVDIYGAEQNAAEVQLTISAGNVISAVIVDGAVGTVKLADNAVTTAKIADGNVTKEKLSTAVQASLDKADASASKTELATEQGRIKALEDKLAGSGEGTVASQIANVKSEAAQDATTKANAAKADAITAAAADAKTKADAAQAAAEATAAADATNKANKALEDAKAYTDEAYGAIIALTPEEVEALLV